LTPPFNFGLVVPGKIFRSSFPSSENFAHLSSLGLRTVLTLVPGPYPAEYLDFISRSATINRYITLELQTNKAAIGIRPGTMASLLQIINDEDNYPLLLHCNKGKHRSGCLVGAFRLVRGEPLGSVLEEYHRYAGRKAREFDVEFLKSMVCKIV
jgi:protein tyrosine/serine phosphatase